MIKAIAASLLGGFVAGFLGGAIVTFEYYQVKGLKVQVNALKLDRARYRQAIGFGNGLEEDHDAIEVSNEEIIKAIMAKATKSSPVPNPGQDAGKACSRVPDNRVCIDAGSLLDLGKLR